MTALLELKQKIKNLYGQYEIYILPVLRCILAFLYFTWINVNMGYMSQLNNIFIVLILALICSILPSGVMIFACFALMIAHGYALGAEVAGFLLLLILFMLILFLRFSAGTNLVLVFTPLSFGFSIPALLPIGSGLLSSAVSALPAGCGVIVYYFIRFLKVQHKLLENPDVLMTDKLKLLADGVVQNWGMWITVVAFVAVILLVNLIRTRSFDYAWRISIVMGGVVYVLIILAGGFYFGLNINIVQTIIYTVVSVVVGLLLEFLVFGGDYSRTERLEYEDDEYYYYVKAVPKAAVATSERSIKKINAEPVKEDTAVEDQVVSYANPIFHGENTASQQAADAVPVVRQNEVDPSDFEKKLEESLKDSNYRFKITGGALLFWKGERYAEYCGKSGGNVIKNRFSQGRHNRHYSDCTDRFFCISVHGMDKIYPCLYPAERNSGSSPVYPCCLYLQDEYHFVDFFQSGQHFDRRCDRYIPA